MMEKTNPQNEYGYLPNLIDLKNQSLQPNRKDANKDNPKISRWINVKEKAIISLIIEAFVDPQKKKILNHTSRGALTVPEILKICKMPNTSGYRTINSLIKKGLLVKSSITYPKNGRRIYKYRSIFEDVKIMIGKNKISVKIKFAKV